MSAARPGRARVTLDGDRGSLAQKYGWFTEGFDTADLQEARAVLEAP